MINVSHLALCYDLLLLLLFAYTAARAWQRGLLATLAELAGKVLGIAGATWASRNLAPRLYDEYISAKLAERAEGALAESGGSLADALEKMSFLPASVRDMLANTLSQTTDALPAQLVEAMEPVLLPMMQMLVAVLACAVISLVCKLVVKLLGHVNGLPLLGGVNRFLGLLFGLLTGVVNCWLAVMVLWFVATVTAGKIDFMTTDILGHSIGYSFFLTFNPFLTHY